jgi:hypothetical protein
MIGRSRTRSVARLDESGDCTLESLQLDDPGTHRLQVTLRHIARSFT